MYISFNKRDFPTLFVVKISTEHMVPYREFTFMFEWVRSNIG